MIKNILAFLTVKVAYPLIKWRIYPFLKKASTILATPSSERHYITNLLIKIVDVFIGFQFFIYTATQIQQASLWIQDKLDEFSEYLKLWIDWRILNGLKNIYTHLLNQYVIPSAELIRKCLLHVINDYVAIAIILFASKALTVSFHSAYYLSKACLNIYYLSKNWLYENLKLDLVKLCETMMELAHAIYNHSITEAILDIACTIKDLTFIFLNVLYEEFKGLGLSIGNFTLECISELYQFPLVLTAVQTLTELKDWLQDNIISCLKIILGNAHYAVASLISSEFITNILMSLEDWLNESSDLDLQALIDDINYYFYTICEQVNYEFLIDIAINIKEFLEEPSDISFIYLSNLAFYLLTTDEAKIVLIAISQLNIETFFKSEDLYSNLQEWFLTRVIVPPTAELIQAVAKSQFHEEYKDYESNMYDNFNYNLHSENELQSIY